MTLIARFGPPLIALVDVQTRDLVARPEQLFRYQYSNNIDSSVLDLGEKGELVSYTTSLPCFPVVLQLFALRLAILDHFEGSAQDSAFPSAKN